MKLATQYRGEWLQAEVSRAGIRFDGVTYGSPSAAARAAKIARGIPPTAAHTNGWLFWDYLDEVAHVYSPIYHLRNERAADTA